MQIKDPLAVLRSQTSVPSKTALLPEPLNKPAGVLPFYIKVPGHRV